MRHGMVVAMCAGALWGTGCGGDLADELRNLLGQSGGQPPPEVAAPRLIAPLSGSLVSTDVPQFRWALATGSDGAAVDICADRSCQKVLVSFASTGASGTPPAPLPAGAAFWRARGRAGGATGPGSSPVWELFVPHRTASPSAVLQTRADFDGDGYTDAILDGRVLRGGPTGFVGSLDVPPGPPDAVQTVAFAAGDLNGDGYGDLIRVDETNPPDYALVGLWTPVPLLGGPTGFTAGTADTGTGPSGALYGAAAAGDANGDGYADALFKSRFELQTWQGAPAGIVRGPLPVLQTSQSFFASDGDVNGDGFSDVVSNSNGEQGFTVTLGSPAGFAGTSATEVSLPAQPAIGGVVLLDANGDGYSDLGVDMSDGTWLFAGSAGGFSPTPLLTLSGTLSPVGWADFNGDGQPDLLLRSNDALEVHYGHGGAPDAGRVAVVTPPRTSDSYAAANPTSGALGDVNGDGYDDLVVTVYTLDSATQLYRATSARLYLGSPGGLDPMGTPAG